MDSLVMKKFFNLNDETYWQILILKIYVLIILNEVSEFNEMNGKTTKVHRHSIISAWIAIILPVYYYYDRSMTNDYQPLLAWLFGLHSVFNGSEFTMCFGYFLTTIYTFPVIDVYIDVMLLVCFIFEIYDVRRTLAISPYILFVPLWFFVLGGFKHMLYLNFVVGLYDFFEVSEFPKISYYFAMFFIWSYYQYKELREALLGIIANSSATNESVS